MHTVARSRMVGNAFGATFVTVMLVAGTGVSFVSAFVGVQPCSKSSFCTTNSVVGGFRRNVERKSAFVWSKHHQTSSNSFTGARMTVSLERSKIEDGLSTGFIENLKELTEKKEFQFTGTSALKLQVKKESGVLDDVLTSIFQVGGKLLWPNDNAVLAVGHLNDLIGDKPLFMPLNQYFHKYGGVYKLSFAPVPQATFYVLSDPAAVKHVLKEKTFNFDKGLLAEILQPILGKGLIPADIETWRERRPVVQPGFHQRWLQRMTRTFNDCALVLADKLSRAERDEEVVDMEALFNSVSLDIIGKAVFNYEFGSVTTQSPVIQAAYACLKEAEHRSTFLVPYWNVPVLGSGPLSLIPRQREFAGHLKVLNDKLDEMVAKAKELKHEGDLEMLEKRDYDSMADPSLLRFLVDLRGGDTTDQQLRDDLMTLLVAGHETTGSLLTWTLFELAQNPTEMRKVQEEIDRVLAGRDPTVEDIKSLEYLRLVLVEGLRLYPQPPILLRRCLEDTTLPRAHTGALGEQQRQQQHQQVGGDDGGEGRQSGGMGMQEKEVGLSKGANVFISVWNLHRNPALWDNANHFDPERWRRRQDPSSSASSWKGYTPKLTTGLYPNEVDADFGFIPFGGGQRKCVGDQFAMMEAVIVLAQVLGKFDLSLATAPEDVGMSTGATIHTRNGLQVKVARRAAVPAAAMAARH